MVAAARRQAAALPSRAASSFPARVLRRFVAINGRDRSLVLGGQTFTTVIPLLIVVAATTGRSGSSLIADRLTERFRLSGSAAEAVQTLFRRPPGATGAITIAGVLLLLFSLLSLTRSLQRTFEAAWRLPPAGMRGTLDGLTGLGLLLASLLVLSLLVGALRPLPAGTVLAAVLRAVISAAIWLVLQRLLLSRRVSIRRLVPGAIVAGVGQTLISIYSALWMPRMIEENANRYGVIGVTFALVSWLIVVGFAIVISAVVSAEAGGAEPPAAGWPARWGDRLSALVGPAPAAGAAPAAPASPASPATPAAPATPEEDPSRNG
jgi:membrane protein